VHPFQQLEIFPHALKLGKERETNHPSTESAEGRLTSRRRTVVDSQEGKARGALEAEALDVWVILSATS
jgi:hypothetical protein